MKRPFKAGGLMGTLSFSPSTATMLTSSATAAGNEAQTDAKAIKDAEKAQAKTTKKEL